MKLRLASIPQLSRKKASLKAGFFLY